MDNTTSFSELFTFSRDRVAPYRDASGTVIDAAIDHPRFDHDAAGQPLGLLIEGQPETAIADRVSFAHMWVPEAEAGTILHDYVTPSGRRRTRAIFTERPRRSIEALLGLRGHHRAIGYVSGYLRRTSTDPLGYVKWGGRIWAMAGVVTCNGSRVLSAGGPLNPLMLEG